MPSHISLKSPKPLTTERALTLRPSKFGSDPTKEACDKVGAP